MPKISPPYVQISIGEDENSHLNNLYVDLVLQGGRTYTLSATYNGLENLYGYQFMDEFGKQLNEAILFSSQLHTPITVDDSVSNFAEELEEGLWNKLCKEYDWKGVK